MKKKKLALFSALAVACIIFGGVPALSLSDAGAKSAAGETISAPLGEAYAKWGIEIKNDVFFYKSARVRIFMDMRADGSFVTAFADVAGSADVCLTRNADAEIVSIELIDEKQAREILEDFGVGSSSSASTDQKSQLKKAVPEITRMTKEELPKSVLTAIDACTEGGWLAVADAELQYIFHAGLPGNYAYELRGNALSIIDMGKSAGQYVLLALPKALDLTVSYNNIPVALTKPEGKGNQ